MKRVLIIAVCSIQVLLLLGFMPNLASAHELATDGSISAVLHTEPDDDPISGARSSLILFINDNTNRFSLANCVCTITILVNGQAINTLPVVAVRPGYSQNAYTFPNPDTYTIHLSGRPIVDKGFQPFAVNFTVRAGPSASGADKTKVSPVVWVGLSLMIAAILAAAIYQDYNYKRQSKPKP